MTFIYSGADFGPGSSYCGGAPSPCEFRASITLDGQLSNYIVSYEPGGWLPSSENLITVGSPVDATMSTAAVSLSTAQVATNLTWNFEAELTPDLTAIDFSKGWYFNATLWGVGVPLIQLISEYAGSEFPGLQTEDFVYSQTYGEGFVQNSPGAWAELPALAEVPAWLCLMVGFFCLRLTRTKSPASGGALPGREIGPRPLPLQSLGGADPMRVDGGRTW